MKFETTVEFISFYDILIECKQHLQIVIQAKKAKRSLKTKEEQMLYTE